VRQRVRDSWGALFLPAEEAAIDRVTDVGISCFTFHAVLSASPVIDNPLSTTPAASCPYLQISE